MKIIKIISEWKKRPTPDAQAKNGKVGYGDKMIMAIVQFGNGRSHTRHIKVAK